MSETPNKTNHRCNLHGVSMLKPLEMVQACVIQTLASKIRDLTKFKYWTAPFQLRARVRAWHLWVRTPHHALTNQRLDGFSFSAQELGRLSPVFLSWPFLVLLLSSLSTVPLVQSLSVQPQQQNCITIISGCKRSDLEMIRRRCVCMPSERKPSPIKAGDLLNVQKFDWMTWSQISSVCCLQEQPSNIFLNICNCLLLLRFSYVNCSITL